MTVAEIKAFFIIGIALGSATGANQSATAGDKRAEDVANEQVDDSAYIQKLSHHAEASRSLLSARRSTRYASKICVENAASLYAEYKVKDTTKGKVMKDWTNGFGMYKTETKCSKLSSANAGDTIEVKIRAQSSKHKEKYDFVYYDNAKTATIKVTGTLSKWDTSCDSCQTSLPNCESPTVSDIVNSNVVYTQDVDSTVSKTCHNNVTDDLNGDQACEAEFTWSVSQDQTIEITDGYSVTEGVSVSLEQDWEITGTTAGVEASVSITESFEQSTTNEREVVYTSDSICSQTVKEGGCVLMESTFVGGTLSGDWSGTLTCDNGLTKSVSGKMKFSNAYSTAATEACLTNPCPDDVY